MDWSDVPQPEPGADVAYVPRPVPRIMAVANQKGGVGKTTTAVNLGAGLAEIGFRVLVVDLDPQGNATTGLGIDGRSFELSMYDVLMRDSKLEDAIEPTSMKNLFVAPATIDLAGAEIELVPTFSRELKLRRALESVIDDFDYILIDCPPSLGLITVNGLAAADEVLVPIQCEYYALEGLGPAPPQRAPRPGQPQREAGRVHDRAHHVRRQDQAGRAGGGRGPPPLRQQGVSERDPPDGADLRGTVIRSTHHDVRPHLAWGDRLPGASQGGQRWRVVADWARVWGH